MDKRLITLPVILLCCIVLVTQAKAQAVNIVVKNHHHKSKVADTCLHFPTPHARQVEIWGCNKLWQNLTRIECLSELKTEDKHIITVVLRQFYFTDQKKTRYDDPSLPDGGDGRITVRVTGDRPDSYADVSYMRRGRMTDVTTTVIGGSQDGNTFRGPLKPGYGRRFESLVRLLARRARHRNRAVTIAATPVS